MNSSVSPLQGESLSWELICVADELDQIAQKQYFLQALYKIVCDDPSLMDSDLLYLLGTYLDTEPREKLQGASDKLSALSRIAKDFLTSEENQ
jgi:hypothetical protein